MATFRTRKSCSADVSILRIVFGPITPALELGSHVNRRFRTDKVKGLPDTMVRRHIRAKHLEDVTGRMLEDFITMRIREDGISAKTANRTREVLHKLFNYATQEMGFVAPDRRHPNPAALVQRRPEPPRVIRFLTAEQVTRQLEILADQPTLHAMVATLIYAGPRREAVLWLTPEDVDLERRLLHIRAKKIAGESWQPKTKRNRVVPISSALQRILSAYEPPTEGPWYFPSPRGCRWNPDNFSQTLREINSAHGLAMVVPGLPAHLRQLARSERRVALQDRRIDGQLAGEPPVRRVDGSVVDAKSARNCRRVRTRLAVEGARAA
jgi:integrase